MFVRIGYGINLPDEVINHPSIREAEELCREMMTLYTLRPPFHSRAICVNCTIDASQLNGDPNNHSIVITTWYPIRKNR